jgi:outer membrane lipoprotein carrier protein
MLLRALVAALLAATPAAADDAGLALARRVDQRQAAVRDLTARFEQRYRSGALGRELVERGTLAIRRPGRMRWEYREPERKTFVSDGRTFYFYVPADRQVIVRQTSGERGLTARLLSGEGGLVSQFEVGLEASPGPGLQRLRLVPREPDPDVERVYLDVDAQARIVGLELFDAQGNRSRFRFEELKENVGLGEGPFRFEIPAGVEVVTG